MKRIILSISVLLVPIVSFCQTEKQLTIKTQAELMVNAFIKEDYDVLLDYTYPKIFEIAGGREIMKELVVQMLGEMKAQGMTVDSAKVGEPGEIYTAGNELHAVIPQFIYMSLPDGKLSSESSLLAISMDNGANWYFLDVKQLTPELKALFFPDFNNALIVPEPKEPVIVFD